ncbi:hypothetical protein SDC9_186291 [bioreactor metagenome]|uniref:Uncharacterized protein n=1 Tax=bioreactor metagenome TaxID=1076179 RepID=A0A645HJI8_9ZZZZ
MRGVPDAAAVQCLLAVRGIAPLAVVLHGEGQGVLPLAHRRSNINGKRQVPVAVAAHLKIVDQHGAALVHRAKV